MEKGRGGETEGKEGEEEREEEETNVTVVVLWLVNWIKERREEGKQMERVNIKKTKLVKANETQSLRKKDREMGEAVITRWVQKKQ